MARIPGWLAPALAVVVLAVPAALAGGPGAAGSVAVNVWQLTAVYPENSGVDAIAAASPANAWAAENCTGACRTGSDGLTLRHWNGAQWDVVTDPAAFAHLGGGTPLLAMAPGADSAPWALDGSVAVRWAGKAWAAPTGFAGNVQLSAAVAPSASAVWALGQTTAGEPVAVRYNGKAWSMMPAPPIAPSELSATSTAAVWAIGPAEGGVPNALTWPMVASHWVGGRWATTKLPSAALDDGSYLQSLSIVAEGADGAWAFGQVLDEDVPGTVNGMQLYRWNGAKWLAAAIPYQLAQASGISSDGHGGIWFAASGDDGKDYLVHDGSGGQWSEKLLPMPAGASSAVVNAVVPVPGSALLWAGGTATVPTSGTNPGGTEGEILRYPA